MSFFWHGLWAVVPRYVTVFVGGVDALRMGSGTLIWWISDRSDAVHG